MAEPLNIFEGVRGNAPDEIVTKLLDHPALRIERIVSTGQSTPPSSPYDQDHDEWVLLLSGQAGLWIEGEGECRLRPGDCVFIAAHRRHRVTFTAKDQPTIWLAIHFPPQR